MFFKEKLTPLLRSNKNFKHGLDLKRIVLLGLIISAFITFLIYFYFSFLRYFHGDDFPMLMESSRSLKILLSPQGNVHFRPIARLHFWLINIFGLNPILFNLWTLFLHFIAAFSMYIALKEVFNRQIAVFSSLLFYTIFSYNETTFWISQAQLIYCLIFSFLSIYAAYKKRIFFACFFIILASLSYTLWLVLLPFFLFEKRIKKKVFYFSLTVFGFYMILIKILSLPLSHYSPLQGITEIPKRMIYCLYYTFFPFVKFSAKFMSLIIFVLLTFISVYLFLKKRKIALLPLAFYFIPSFIYLLSKDIPSRFYYFPAVGIAVMASLLFFVVKKPYNIIGAILILYLAVFSPILNYQDGTDYMVYSLEFKKIIKKGDVLKDLQQNNKILLINKVSISIPHRYSINKIFIGRSKLLFFRGKGLGGLVFLKDFVDFILYKKGLKSIPIEPDDQTKIITIGDKNYVSKYCFLVTKIN